MKINRATHSLAMDPPMNSSISALFVAACVNFDSKTDWFCGTASKCILRLRAQEGIHADILMDQGCTIAQVRAAPTI